MTNLKALEAAYTFLNDRTRHTWPRIAETNELNQLIVEMIAESEVDLGIEWKDGKFSRKGAAYLDNKLVNDVLHWLQLNKHKTVLGPFEKGIAELLKIHSDETARWDVIRDMYEALEALGKIITGNNWDLSRNREGFISKIMASHEYKTLLKNYVDYANRLFRHAQNPDESKPHISEGETESFVYLTGLFIRLAIANN